MCVYVCVCGYVMQVFVASHTHTTHKSRRHIRNAKTLCRVSEKSAGVSDALAADREALVKGIIDNLGCLRVAIKT